MPFDPTDFDIDAFIVSDKLSEKGKGGNEVGLSDVERNIDKDM